MSRSKIGFVFGTILAVLFGPAAQGQAPSGKVVVVTSFSKDVTDPIKKSFEKAVPGVTLEVQNRNTNAGVKYVEETKSNNQVDLFWASAPDAFEVLKAKGLLQNTNRKQLAFPTSLVSSQSMIRRDFILDSRRPVTGSCGMNDT